MAARHLIVGGGTAGLNAIRTIREEDGGSSEITLVSAERPYSRMVLPYYLGDSIAESHVFTATPASLSAWKVKTLIGRKAAKLDPAARTLTLDHRSTVGRLDHPARAHGLCAEDQTRRHHVFAGRHEDAGHRSTSDRKHGERQTLR